MEFLSIGLLTPSTTIAAIDGDGDSRRGGGEVKHKEMFKIMLK